MTLSLTGLAGLAVVAGVIVIVIRRILARRAEGGQRAARDGMSDDRSWHDHTPEPTHPVNPLAPASDGAVASCDAGPSSGGEPATSSSCDSGSSSTSGD